jgi:crotonobetainyl-CoA:carnitine CoA-transferase CaiB-like acyl-CoA transferase
MTMYTRTPTTAPLAGIRVVELASFVAAPAAGALLADLGAEVIKIEIPEGELYRHSRPKLLGIKSDFPEAAHFQMDNRGKRSLALDLTREAARDAVARLLDRADVFLTNMLGHRLERYGLDAATLRSRRPELIVAALSGYGPEGPDATRPAFDYAAYWARTGFMDLMHEPDSPPAYQRPGIGDHAAALALVSGILAALRVRDQTGAGQTVDVSLMHIGFYVLGNDAAQTLATGVTPPRHDRRAPRNPLWNQYRTRDDRWLFLVMIESDRYWPPFCRAIDRADLLRDERFTNAPARYKAAAELVAILDEVFAAHTLSEWRQALADQPIIWAPVWTLAEAVHDPQARAAGVFTPVDHPSAGRYETVAPPIRLSGHAMRGERPAPALGADGAAVLKEAGLDDDAIAAALAPAVPRQRA